MECSYCGAPVTADMTQCPVCHTPLVQQAVEDTSGGVSRQAGPVLRVGSMTKRTKLLVWAVCGLLLLAVAGVGLVHVLNDTVFSPRGVAEQYVSALSQGRYDQASRLVNPQVDKDKAVLLTDAAARGGSPIANVQVMDVKYSSAYAADVAYSYSLDGKRHQDSVHMISQGNAYLVFKKWTISEPVTKDLIVHTSQQDHVVINGIPLEQKNVQKRDDAILVKAYPGSYTISLAEGEFFQADPVTALVAEKGSENTLDVTQKDDAIEEAINKAIHDKLDTCAMSDRLQTIDCPFTYIEYPGFDYATASWTITKYPKVMELGSSSFSTSTEEPDANGLCTVCSGEAHTSVKYKMSDEYYDALAASMDMPADAKEWETSDYSPTFDMRGTFTVTWDGVLTEFDDSTWNPMG